MSDLGDLLSILKEKSYQKKKVILASGKESDFYIDVRQSALHPKGANLIGKLFCQKLSNGDQVKAVGGPTLGADPIVSAISVISFQDGKPLPAFIVRKEAKVHGAKKWLEGEGNLSKGMSVAMVEDVTTTGESLLKAILRVQEAGYAVKRVLTVVDREEGAALALQKAGFTLEPLFTKSDF